MFLKVRDRVQELLALTGAFRCDVIANAAFGGSNWDNMACLERLVEIGELVCVYQGYSMTTWVYVGRGAA